MTVPSAMTPSQELDRQLGSAATISAAGSTSVAALQALEQYKKRDSSKVVVRFKAIGNAPIMKNNHFRITAFNRFQAVTVFLRKELNFKPSDSLFLYINASFSPAPDDTVGNLYRCFGTEGHLIVNYSTTAAWG
ncbi:putative Autophagy-related protein 12 [Mycosarcoma maydis]|uniref:Ubiquitin-like protein ATG12 n=1 Tax=Mycosarcoma maydis TaxID=5270 RepID=A0A0D1DY14_MYCMD|nr:putative Autophagy-related protein 12 [Ustilago maydis 521]KIS68491.1 putative Autophagy-related protein 12 [Ustilago maydis 521]|eukprot:XP_011390120.1 putative Autophagy-related protein 12 [Ustilago maydis 521]